MKPNKSNVGICSSFLIPHLNRNASRLFHKTYHYSNSADVAFIGSHIDLFETLRGSSGVLNLSNIKLRNINLNISTPAHSPPHTKSQLHISHIWVFGHLKLIEPPSNNVQKIHLNHNNHIQAPKYEKCYRKLIPDQIRSGYEKFSN